MSWSMTVVQGVDSVVVTFDDEEVAFIVRMNGLAAREVLFGKAEEKGFWRTVEAKEAIAAAGDLRAACPPEAKRLKGEFQRLARSIRKGGVDVWIGVG